VADSVATYGWGDVLYVEVYARSRDATLVDLSPELCKAVAVTSDPPYERATIKWRLSHA
jgi:hypothetical protein